jgi:hypothetical protein
MAVSRRYWWVNQTTNFDAEVGVGRIWASANRHGTLIKGRSSILEMAPGDIVFHYNRAAIRATSRVEKAASRSNRPAAYPKVDPREPGRGWTVRVQVIRRGLCVDAKQVSAELPRGTVLDKNGQVNRRYIFELRGQEAAALANLAKTPLPTEDSVFGHPFDELVDKADPTDARTWARIRLEQAALRDHLLAGDEEGRCALCDAKLPSKLLIAAHIKPRRDCTNEERRNFDAIAMLLCSLGCDVLFEWGYVIVDEDGFVRPGAAATHPDLRRAVKRLDGRRCRRHDVRTASYFAVRAAAVLRSLSPA